MQLFSGNMHPTGMTTTTERSIGHKELQEEYAAALRLWSETRGVYASNSPEVFEATALLDDLEAKLRQHPVKLLTAPNSAN